MYMLQAARGGDRDAMIYMAKAYDTGNGLGTKMYVAMTISNH